MTKISIADNEDGTATMSGPFGDLRMQYFNCDGCGESANIGDRHIVWQKPWHGEYWGDIFWTGPCCAEQFGAEHHSLGNPDERE